MRLRISEKSIEVTKEKVLKIRNDRKGTYEIIDLTNAGHVIMQKMKRRRSLRDGFTYSTLVMLSLSILGFMVGGMFFWFYIAGGVLLIGALLKHRFLDGMLAARLHIIWKDSDKRHMVDLRDFPEEDLEYLFDLIASRF